MASLSPDELEIMKVLWKEGPLKPAEIQQRLSRPVKNSALRWRLGALMEKKHVARRKKGKAFYYRATVSRDRVFRKLIRRIGDVFAGGSAVALIGRVVESQEEWSDEDVRELQRIASQTEPSTSKTTSKPDQDAKGDRQ